MPIIEIQLLTAQFMSKLEDKINRALADGWTFHGGLFLVPGDDDCADFAQAMIRPVAEANIQSGGDDEVQSQ